MESFLSDLFSAAKTAGPFSTILMIGLWWLERGERREIQKAYQALVPDMLKSITSTKTAVQYLTALISGKDVRIDNDDDVC